MPADLKSTPPLTREQLETIFRMGGAAYACAEFFSLCYIDWLDADIALAAGGREFLGARTALTNAMAPFAGGGDFDMQALVAALVLAAPVLAASLPGTSDDEFRDNDGQFADVVIRARDRMLHLFGVDSLSGIPTSPLALDTSVKGLAR